jgi:hypothetical protein
MFGVFGRFRRNSKQLQQSNDDSIGDTIPTKHQFFMELPVKRQLEPVESLLLSFGSRRLSERIRSTSTVSSLSSNSVSTFDLPRREKSLKGEDSQRQTTCQTTSPPLACCAPLPMFLEEETPPLKNDQHAPTLWKALFSCCSPDALNAEATYSVAQTAGCSDKSLFGYFDTDEEGEAEASNKVARKKGGLRAWRQRGTKKQEVF